MMALYIRFPKPMRAGGYYPLFTYKLLKINVLISIYLTSLGVKAKGGKTENDGTVYPEL